MMTTPMKPVDTARDSRRPGAMATENFRRQHAELLELAAEIGSKLSPDMVERNAGDLRRLLAQFAGRLNIHARMENEALYPRLFEHRDAHVRDRAEALFSEVGSVYDAFGALLKEWPTAAEMAQRPADFIRQTLKVFRLLGKRMLREESELYPLVDTLE